MTADSEPPLVSRFLTDFATDMAAAARKHCAQDIYWVIPRSIGRRREWRGIDDVLAFLNKASALFVKGSMSVEISRTVECPGWSIAMARITGTALSGRIYENEYAFLLATEGDLIVEVHEYVDTTVVHDDLLQRGDNDQTGI
jgi:ketosteroid isomerase-like protein